MINAPFSGQAFDDGAYGLPAIELTNWYVEEASDRPDKTARLIPTPGLSEVATLGGNPVQKIGLSDNIHSEPVLLVHSADELYHVNQAGTILATTALLELDGVTRFASSQLETVAAVGNKAYLLSSTTSQEIAFPGGFGVVDVAELGQRHLYVEENSGRMWYSEVADAANVLADAFITAEDESDELRAIQTFQGSAYLYGSRSIQVIRPTGNEATPFIPSPGGTLPKGVIGKAAVTVADFGQFFVGDDHVVYRLSGYQAQRISTHWIERRIQDLPFAARGLITLNSHVWEGHTFLDLRLPGVGTYVYDAATQRWHRRASYLSEESKISSYQEAFGKIFAGTPDGLFTLDRNVATEGSDVIVRTASTLVPVSDGRPHVKNIVIEGQAGLGALDEDEPEVMVSLSDNGRTWRRRQTAKFGRLGQYNRRSVLGPFGNMQPPFFGLRVETSASVPITLTAAKINMERP